MQLKKIVSNFAQYGSILSNTVEGCCPGIFIKVFFVAAVEQGLLLSPQIDKRIRFFGREAYLLFFIFLSCHRSVLTVSQTSSRTSRYGKITVVCPKYNREMEGGKSFLISAAKLWNSIPTDIRSCSNIGTSKNKYRTFLTEQYLDLDNF